MIWPQISAIECNGAVCPRCGRCLPGIHSEAVRKIMRKFVSRLVALTVLLPLGGTVPAAVVGSDAPACEAGKPSIEVVVSGFKQPTGTLKVTLYDGNPA